MIIGLPKEIKAQEYRVALTPKAVGSLVRAGHSVLMEKGAGRGCGFLDTEFQKEGAQIVTTVSKIWSQANLVVKVKEPLESEFSYFRPGLILFTYLHLASAPALARALVQKQMTAIGYETVLDASFQLPLLKPMSRIAGKLATLLGADFLRTDRGVKGILLSDLEGTRPGRVTILGAGNVGRAALEVALGIGAEVTLIDQIPERLEEFQKNPRCQPLIYHPKKLTEILQTTDLLIGAVSMPGARTPRLVTKKMVSTMEPGSVIIDVSVDQGACVESIHPTTHAQPIYTYKKILHYGVPNMPSLVSHSATEALSYQTLPYVLKLAQAGLDAFKEDSGFLHGLQIHKGKIVHGQVAKALKL